MILSFHERKIFYGDSDMLTSLRRARLLREMSLYDLRARTGISVSKLSLVERGIEQASKDERKRLARALSVPVDDLFPKE